ncbi:MAG: hypothetical protein H7A37_07410 [Chlamydiales bacterium]|nr:hypothetical protein [Chlamydiia bacterium]MCP5508111.1 hypothetical protein [Chlamydiales bacterium]
MRKVLIAAFIAINVSLFAYDDSPSCFRRLETGFFNTRLVTQALNMHGVYQSQWAPILLDLRQNARQVPRIVRSRARKMNPNPIQNPFDPTAAQKLLMDVLYEVFADTMRNNDLVNQGILNQDDINDMFNYIWSNQVNELEACFITPYLREKEEQKVQQEEEQKANTVIDEVDGKLIKEQDIVVPKNAYQKNN